MQVVTLLRSRSENVCCLRISSCRLARIRNRLIVCEISDSASFSSREARLFFRQSSNPITATTRWFSISLQISVDTTPRLTSQSLNSPSGKISTSSQEYI